jgi:putative acetyltransferase
MNTKLKHSIIRPIRRHENALVAGIIRQVLTEFGANREGFAFVDTELDALYEHFLPPEAAYFVAEIDGRIFGGAGFGPLLGGDGKTAELKKMYLLPEARGMGLGQKFIQTLLPMAKEAGYDNMYLETTETMKQAIELYKRSEFKRLDKAMGTTGHFACEIFYIRSLISE